MHESARSVAYVVSMVAGMEAFVYREVDWLYGSRVNVELFATRFKRGDVYAPKPGWSYHSMTPVQMVLRAPLLFILLILNPALVIHALKWGTFIDLVFALWFSRTMKARGVQQIHCHFGDHKLFIGYYCKRLTGLPLSVTIHAHEMYVNPNGRFFPEALASCDRIFAISDLARNKLIREFGANPDRVMVSRLGVNTHIWSPSRRVKVLTVGRFQPRKGFDVLFDAASRIKDLPVEYVIAGFGPLDIRELASKYGVQDRVTVFNKLDQAQLRILYQTCDIYCLPSTTDGEQGTEGIPVVLMEAMACGMPVIASDCGAVGELVREKLVPERDPVKLAQALREWIEDQEIRVTQGIENRKIVEKNYSEENIRKFSESLLSIGNGEARS